MHSQRDFQTENLQHKVVMLAEKVQEMEQSLFKALHWDHVSYVNFTAACDEVARIRAHLCQCLSELSQSRHMVKRQAATINDDDRIDGK